MWSLKQKPRRKKRPGIGPGGWRALGGLHRFRSGFFLGASCFFCGKISCFFLRFFSIQQSGGASRPKRPAWFIFACSAWNVIDARFQVQSMFGSGCMGWNDLTVVKKKLTHAEGISTLSVHCCSFALRVLPWYGHTVFAPGVSILCLTWSWSRWRFSERVRHLKRHCSLQLGTKTIQDSSKIDFLQVWRHSFVLAARRPRRADARLGDHEERKPPGNQG